MFSEPNNRKPSILVVEDEDSTRYLLSKALTGENYDVVSAGTCSEGVEFLGRKAFALLLLDKNLPDGTGFDIVRRAREQELSCEVIMVSGYSDTDSAIEGIKLGVFRYIRKPFELEELLLDIRKAIETCRLRRNLKQTNIALRRSEQRYRTLFNSGNDAIFVYPFNRDETQTNIIEVNNVACKWFGYTREEFLKQSISSLFHPDYATSIQDIMKRLDSEQHIVYETLFVSRGQEEFPVEISSLLIELDENNMVLDIVRDMSERYQNNEARTQLEEQIYASQKMEAMGRLAGGIAHDINNVLSTILGFSSVLELEAPPGATGIDDIKGIVSACVKGRDLTQNLLGFARKGTHSTKRLSLNELVEEMVGILNRTLAKTISIETDLQDRLERIEGNSSELNQALMNICLNAVDAMPDAGVLKISTRNASVDDARQAVYLGLKQGRYVSIELRDNGSGMDSATLKQAFEPFFTSKPKGKGTGLGLAMVYRTVENHLGAIDINSRLGEGTAVKIYFPSAGAISSMLPSMMPVVYCPMGEGKVLLVDDEQMVLNASKRVLERLGYSVIATTSGKESIELYSRNVDDIKLVVIDMMMPEMSGKEIMRALQKIDPEVKVLISSGFSEESLEKSLIASGAKGFIQKPYDLNTFAETLERIIQLGN